LPPSRKRIGERRERLLEKPTRREEGEGRRRKRIILFLFKNGSV